jgi:hypothetical protein
MAEEVTGDELATVLGLTGATLTIKGAEVKIAPLVLEQIAEVMVCIERLSEAGVVKVTGKDGVFGKDFNPTKLLLRGGKDFIRILAIASAQPVERVGKLNALETAQLAGKVWEVNKDFFVRNRVALLEALGGAANDLIGMVKGLLESWVAKMAAQAGRAQSSASSKAAIGSTR